MPWACLRTADVILPGMGHLSDGVDPREAALWSRPRWYRTRILNWRCKMIATRNDWRKERAVLLL